MRRKQYSVRCADCGHYQVFQCWAEARDEKVWSETEGWRTVARLPHRDCELNRAGDCTHYCRKWWKFWGPK